MFWFLWCSWQTVTRCQWQLLNLFSSAPSLLSIVLIIHSRVPLLIFATSHQSAFFIRLPSSWHVTFVKKYGMERKQKLHWLSCDTEGRDWLRLRTPEGGREFAAPTQTRAWVRDSSLAAATHHSHNPRRVSQHSPRTREQGYSDPLREVWRKQTRCCVFKQVDEEKCRWNDTSEVGMRIRFGGRIVLRLEDTGQ